MTSSLVGSEDVYKRQLVKPRRSPPPSSTDLLACHQLFEVGRAYCNLSCKLPHEDADLDPLAHVCMGTVEKGSGCYTWGV
eukprot:5404814-Prorocentrum_lima.AAC.1